jgi:7-carboxy-7-deazaguanine synthase
MYLKISEIVSSLQGEGKYTGFPTTFIRLQGCNLNCSYCDTKHATEGKGKRMGIDTILEFVFKMRNRHICITGGEPLLQENLYCLLYELVDRGYIVNIETNGAVLIETVATRSFSYCMDIKCPSSGMSRKNIFSNLKVLLPQDEVKCVIDTYDDYEYARNILKEYPTKAQVILSPCFKGGKCNGAEIAKWMVEDNEPIMRARLGVQMHKLINIY